MNDKHGKAGYDHKAMPNESEKILSAALIMEARAREKAEIERKAQIKALEWAHQYGSHSLYLEDPSRPWGVDNQWWNGKSRIWAELARLKAEGGKNG